MPKSTKEKESRSLFVGFRCNVSTLTVCLNSPTPVRFFCYPQFTDEFHVRPTTQYHRFTFPGNKHPLENNSPPLLVIIIVPTILSRSQKPPPRLLLLHDLLVLIPSESLNPFSHTRWLTDTIRNLPSSNQTYDDTRAYDKCQHETVDTVPRRGPAATFGAGISVVEEVECEELGDESVFDRQEDGGPGYGSADDADGVAGVAFVAAVRGPF